MKKLFFVIFFISMMIIIDLVLNISGFALIEKMNFWQILVVTFLFFLTGSTLAKDE